jgi:transposase
VELSAKRDLLVSINGVGEVLAGIVLAELQGPDILGFAAYAGLHPQQHQSGISLNRPVQISKIGNAVLRTALYMSALSAMRYNPAVIALVDRLKARGRLKGKQIVIAAMRKLLVLCFGVLKTSKEFDPAMAVCRATAWRRLHGEPKLERETVVKPRSPSGARFSARA